MIDRMHALSITRQAEALGISRWAVYYVPRPVSALDLALMRAPMAHGFVYLAAVLDWASRRVLGWRVSITLDSAFCIAAVDEAIARYGRPEIFNTDQGAQFTSAAFTGLLLDHGIWISMDGKGCWRDNIFVWTAGQPPPDLRLQHPLIELTEETETLLDGDGGTTSDNTIAIVAGRMPGQSVARMTYLAFGASARRLACLMMPLTLLNFAPWRPGHWYTFSTKRESSSATVFGRCLAFAIARVARHLGVPRVSNVRPAASLRNVRLNHRRSG